MEPVSFLLWAGAFLTHTKLGDYGINLAAGYTQEIINTIQNWRAKRIEAKQQQAEVLANDHLRKAVGAALALVFTQALEKPDALTDEPNHLSVLKASRERLTTLAAEAPTAWPALCHDSDAIVDFDDLMERELPKRIREWGTATNPKDVACMTTKAWRQLITLLWPKVFGGGGLVPPPNLLDTLAAILHRRFTGYLVDAFKADQAHGSRLQYAALEIMIHGQLYDLAARNLDETGRLRSEVLAALGTTDGESLASELRTLRMGAFRRLNLLVKELGGLRDDIKRARAEDRRDLLLAIGQVAPTLAGAIDQRFNQQDAPSLLLTPRPDPNRVADRDLGFHQLAYTEQFVPFQGRAAILDDLLRFATEPAIPGKPDAYWWAVVGDGGVGKSRLAQHLCHNLEEAGWHAGFLGSTDRAWLADDRIGRWRPTCSTLIVIDYAVQSSGELAGFFAFLAHPDRRYSHPVRVLLLDRRGSAQGWFAGSLSSKQGAPHLHCLWSRRTQADPAAEALTDKDCLALEPFAATDYLDFIRATLRRLGQPEDLAAMPVELAHLARITQGRPLFLKIVASLLVAHRQRENAARYDLLAALPATRDELLDRVLFDEINHRWTKLVPDDQLAGVVRAVGFATLCRQLPNNADTHTKLRELVGNNAHRSNLLQWASRLLRFAPTDPTITGLTPDLVADRFLLVGGAPPPPNGEFGPDPHFTVEELLVDAYRANPGGMAEALVLMANDFPESDVATRAFARLLALAMPDAPGRNSPSLSFNPAIAPHLLAALGLGLPDVATSHWATVSDAILNLGAADPAAAPTAIVWCFGAATIMAQPILERWDEADAWVARAYAIADSNPDQREPRQSYVFAALTFNELLQRGGQLERREWLLEKMLRPLLTVPEDDREIAIVRGKIADVLEERGQVDEALRIRYEELLPVFERLGDVHSRAYTMGKIADVLHSQSQFDDALRIRLEEELPVYQALGDARSIAVTKGQIADMFQARGNFDEAMRIRREEVLPISDQLGDVSLRASTLGAIADTLVASGKPDEALRICNDGLLPACEELGDLEGMANAAWTTAKAHLARGDFAQAAKHARKAYEILTRIGRLDAIAVVGMMHGKFVFLQGNRNEGLAIVERSRDILRERGKPDAVDQAEQILAAMREDSEAPSPPPIDDNDPRAPELKLVAEANQLLAAGKTDDALAVLRDRVIPMADARGDQAVVTLLHGQVANVLAQSGRIDEALEAARLVEQRHKDADDPMGVAAINILIGQLVFARGNGADGIAIVERSRDAFRQLEQPEAADQAEQILAAMREAQSPPANPT